MTIATIWIPYCGAAPVPAEWLARWNWDPWVLAGLAVAGAAYGFLQSPRSSSRRKPAFLSSWVPVSTGMTGEGPGRPAAFLAAWLLLFLLFVSPFCALTSALFSARVVHHVALAALVAPLLVWSFPAARAPGLWAATAVQASVFWGWHAPPAYALALSSHAAYWAMQASLLATAILFWAAVRRAPAPAAVGALLATMVQMGLLGALITFAPRPLYAPHFVSTAAWAYSPLEDQQLAGLIMWAPAAALYLGAALLLLSRWIGPDPVRAQRG
ncbi:cytochrome c oxidase assembly protein [Sphingosinicella terrae]|uniref:cytochrome c oxidase assembly protein n=1 Tax=Sphingosinicella terrae TaxID=2172047 RepID=UPI000E0CED77|nr:cytochrome c oxidase assembly protein [Sphingosinicella terrae]